MGNNATSVFLRRKGRTIRHVEKHQDIPMDFHYCDMETGREFDVRDLPAEYLGTDRLSVLEGDREAHKAVIRRAIDGAHDFRNPSTSQRVNPTQYAALPLAERVRIAKLTSNRPTMDELRAMLDPHGDLADYTDRQWANLAAAGYRMAPHSTLVATADAPRSTARSRPR